MVSKLPLTGKNILLTACDHEIFIEVIVILISLFRSRISAFFITRISWKPVEMNSGVLSNLFPGWLWFRPTLYFPHPAAPWVYSLSWSFLPVALQYDYEVVFEDRRWPYRILISVCLLPVPTAAAVQLFYADRTLSDLDFRLFFPGFIEKSWIRLPHLSFWRKS